MTLVVYAITHSPRQRLRMRGPSGERLRVVSMAGIAAVVGDVPRCPKPAPATATAYHGLVQHLWSVLPSILPARYGTCFDDEAELRFVLGSRGVTFARALEHVRRRAQMTIRIPGITPFPPPPADERGSGTTYLRARASAAARARSVPQLDPVRPAVRRWIRDERVERRDAGTTVYHLVPRASAEAYRRALMKAAAVSRITLAVTGPFAPFAFADDLLR